MFAGIFTSKWFYFGLLGLGLAGAVFLAVHEYGRAQSAAAKATAICYAQESRSNALVIDRLKSQYEQTIRSLEAENARERLTLEAYTGSLQTITDKYSHLKIELRAILDKNRTAQVWYDTPLPKAIEVLAHNARISSTLPPARGKQP
jgi:hypothetical protein